MKKKIAEYIGKCPTCQKVKAEYQHSVGELWHLEIPTWKWDSISMDFVMGPHITIQVFINEKKNLEKLLLGHDNYNLSASIIFL